MIESLDQEIRTLRAQYWSARDPEGRGFAPLAEAYRLQGEIDEAASLVQDGLERLPGFVAGYLVASRIARDRGDLLGSRVFLDRALDLDRENVVARFERATLSLEERDREGALTDLRTVLDLDPNHQAAAHRLEEIESGSGWESEPEAEVVLESESEFVPEVEAGFAPEVEAEVLLEVDAGNVLESGSVEVAAPVEYSPPPKLNESPDSADSQDEGPDRALVTRTMGDLYAAQGFLDRAVEVYRHLSAADPDDSELRERLIELQGRVRSDGGDGAEGPPVFARPSGGRILAGMMDPAELAAQLPKGIDHNERPVRSYFADLLAWMPGAVPIASLAPDPVEWDEAPVPVELLAPTTGGASIEVLDVPSSFEYPELGAPVPVESLAPNSDGPHPENIR